MRGDFNITAINDNVPNPRYETPHSTFRPRQFLSTNDSRFVSNRPIIAGSNEISWHPNNETGFGEVDVKRSRERQNGGGEKPPPTSRFKSIFRLIILLTVLLCFSGLFINLFMPITFMESALFAPLGASFATLGLFFGQFHWRLKELLAAAFVCFLGATATYYLGMKPLTLALPLILSGVIVGILSKTRLPALFSAFGLTALAYLSSSLVETPLSINPIQGGVITSAIIGLIVVAGLISSRSIMGATLMALYSWIAVWVFGSDLSPYALSCFVFMIAAAQYHLGRSRLNIRAYSAISYIVLGWTISLLAFLTIQWGYMDVSHNAALERGAHAKSSLLWLAGIYCALACILISSVVRRSRTKTSAIGLLVTIMAIGSLPLLSLYPEYFQTLSAQLEFFEFIPGIGIVLAAAGTVASFLMLSTGFARKIYIYKFIGLLGLGAQIALFLSLDPQLFSETNIMIYMVSVSIMACFYTLTHIVKSKA